MAVRKMEIMWLAAFMLVLVWSVVNPKDYMIWALEVSPAIIVIILLALTRARFPLTTLTYVLVLIHCIIPMQRYRCSIT